MSALVNEQAILDALHQVSQDRWGDVLTFIESLRPDGEPVSGPEEHPLTADELLASGLVGLWADRTDIDNRHEFARRLREQAQTRSRG